MRDIDDAGWMDEWSKRQRERANSLKKALSALRLTAEVSELKIRLQKRKKLKEDCYGT